MTLLLGLDLGGTNIKGALLEDGAVRRTASVPTASEDGPGAVLGRVAALGLELLAGARPDAAGLALPGHFDAPSGTGTLLPNLRGTWVGQPIAGPVGDRLGLPVRLVNDVRAMTLAELRLGAGRGARDALCIALGTGVGGGMVIGGRLHLGTAHAGELGHVCVDPEGARCGCGNRGCLDRMASADAIAAMGGRATVGAVIEAARGGDARALAGLREAAGVIAVGLGSAIALLWPERVIVGGGVAEAGELLLDPLREALRERAAVVPADTYDLVRAALGPFAGAAGAALWAAEPQGDGAA